MIKSSRHRSGVVERGIVNQRLLCGCSLIEEN
jgi:hypothetical protein